MSLNGGVYGGFICLSSAFLTSVWSVGARNRIETNPSTRTGMIPEVFLLNLAWTSLRPASH